MQLCNPKNCQVNIVCGIAGPCSKVCNYSWTRNYWASIWYKNFPPPSENSSTSLVQVYKIVPINHTTLHPHNSASLSPTQMCSKSVKTCCNLIFADLLQAVETTCIKLEDKKIWQSTCSKLVRKLQPTCYHQAGASDANASWYRLDDSQVTNLQQTCRLL